jgi:hypothetical protein
MAAAMEIEAKANRRGNTPRRRCNGFVEGNQFSQ